MGSLHHVRQELGVGLSCDGSGAPMVLTGDHTVVAGAGGFVAQSEDRTGWTPVPGWSWPSQHGDGARGEVPRGPQVRFQPMFSVDLSTHVISQTAGSACGARCLRQCSVPCTV